MIPTTWLLLRTTGIVALGLLTLATVIGIVSPAVRRSAGRLTTISIHSAAAATGVLLLVGHVVLAVADAYVDVPVVATVVPGLSGWEPLWIAVGTVAFDLFLLVIITSLTRLRAPTLWRRVHLASLRGHRPGVGPRPHRGYRCRWTGVPGRGMRQPGRCGLRGGDPTEPS